MKLLLNKNHLFALAVLSLPGTSPLLCAQNTSSTFKLAPIPSMTMMEVRYSSAQGSPAQGDSATTPPPITTAKGRNISLKSQTWPDESTSFEVIVKGWRFFNDVTASPDYRDYIHVVEFTSYDIGPQDFPELSFVDAKAEVSEANYKGQKAWLITAAPTPPRYTDEAIATILATLGNASDRREAEINLREAQRLEKKRATEPPNRVWVDPETKLPMAAEIDGQRITYEYRRLTEIPEIPKNFRDAIVQKFGKLPEF